MSSNQISMDRLVESIVREVLAELARRGVSVSAPARAEAVAPSAGEATLEIDMSMYRTPVLTEGRLCRIDSRVSTILVPCNTVVTPGAWGVIRSKKLTLVRKAQHKG